jgi:hypothetical protein
METDYSRKYDDEILKANEDPVRSQMRNILQHVNFIKIQMIDFFFYNELLTKNAMSFEIRIFNTAEETMKILEMFRPLLLSQDIFLEVFFDEKIEKI